MINIWKGFKFFNVDAEKRVPMSSKSEKDTLFQAKMVKIYTFFFDQKPYPLGPHTPIWKQVSIWRENMLG